MKQLAFLRWLTAAATVLVLAFLAWQCIDIYLVGNAPENLDANGVHRQSVYRMEDVAARLQLLSLPLTVYIVLVTLTIVVHEISPSTDENHFSLSPENHLRLLKKRVPTLNDSAKREERFRHNVWIAAWAAIAVCIGFFVAYLLNADNFTSWELEQVMGNMMLYTTPWLVIAFLAAIVAALLSEHSIVREIHILKGQPLTNTVTEPSQKGSTSCLLQGIMYTLALLFIVLGVMNGGLRDVLVKAINICTECIGLG